MATPASKLSIVIDLLGRKKGACIEELASATGWLPHTTRAALTGLRRRGYEIERDRSSVYRIVTGTASAQRPDAMGVAQSRLPWRGVLRSDRVEVTLSVEADAWVPNSAFFNSGSSSTLIAVRPSLVMTSAWEPPSSPCLHAGMPGFALISRTSGLLDQRRKSRCTARDKASGPPSPSCPLAVLPPRLGGALPQSCGVSAPGEPQLELPFAIANGSWWACSRC